MPTKSSQAKLIEAANALLASATPTRKKPGRPPKNPAAEVEPEATAAGAAKRGRKPKAGTKDDGEEDMSDVEAEFAEEPVVETATTEKVKPLRMKISKAKERALMKSLAWTKPSCLKKTCSSAACV